MPFSVIKEVKRVSKKQRVLEKTQEKLVETDIEIGSQVIEPGKTSVKAVMKMHQGGGRCL